MKRERLLRRMTAAILAGLMTVGLTACNDGSTETDGSQAVSDSTFVYVPQWHTIKEEENTWNSNIAIVGSRMYYTRSVYNEEAGSDKVSFLYMDLENPGAEPTVVKEGLENAAGSEEGFAGHVSHCFADKEGNVITIATRYPLMEGEWDETAYRRQQEQTTHIMKKVAADGTELFSVDITSCLMADVDNSYIQYAFGDKNGNIVLSNGNSHIWIYDTEGNLTKDITLDSGDRYSYIRGLGLLSDGRIAYLKDEASSMVIAVYNEEKKDFSDTYDNLPPNCYNSKIGQGLSGGVLLNGDGTLYEYDLETKTYTEILKWLECDMNPDYIEEVVALENGNLAAYYRDWNTNETSLVLLKKTPASEVLQKEVLTLACMNLSQNLQSAVVNFNKNSDKYRIEVKDYAASIDWSQDNAYVSYQDANTRFKNDILTGNAPDMFVAGDVNMDLFAAKGLVEDLNAYLESSTVVNRENLIEPVLNAYTASGILCSIPSTFTVNTLVGRMAEVGEVSGWTIEEVMAYAQQYPDARLMTQADRSSIMRYCLMFNFDSFVNWETGECAFDTPEFKKILEFINSLDGEEPDWSISEPKLLGSHAALLANASISSVSDWQIYEKMFNEPVTAVGFPSEKGTGVAVTGQNGIAMSSSSKNKEAVWSFIESMLTKDAQEGRNMHWGFPVRKDSLDKMLEEAMIPNYRYDADGNIIVDENGEPEQYSNMSYGWEDFQVDIYPATQEEVDSLLAIIDRIDCTLTYDTQLMSIIEEEVPSYLSGQKTLDEVADIIQRRVQLYVNESR